jgi:hypothetical protein
MRDTSLFARVKYGEAGWDGNGFAARIGYFNGMAPPRVKITNNSGD